MNIIYKTEDGKRKIDKIIYENGFQILQNIENEKFFAAKLGELLCIDFDSYTRNDVLWYEFRLEYGDNLPVSLSNDELYDDYLLFENLGNGQIREVISGVILNACFITNFRNDRYKGNEIFNSPRSVEEVQNNRDFEKILANPLGIWISASTNDFDKIIDEYYSNNEEDFEADNDYAYKFDDVFKYYYSEKILPKRELIVKILKNAETIARSYIQGRIDEEMERLHGIALTENIIYDYEQKNARR